MVTVNYAFTGIDALGRVGDGNDLAVTIAAIGVPEPASLGLLAVAGIGLGRRRRRCA